VTLIIALKCTNGVILASDGQATSIASGGPIKQKCRKIFKLPGNVLLGASGTVGVIQRCRDNIAKYSEEISEYGLDYSTEERIEGHIKYITLRDKIKKLVFLINKGERERHKAFHGDERGAPLADIILVFYDKTQDKFRIWHVTPDGGDELLDELGYCCSGIGDTFGYAFLKNFYSEDLDIPTGTVIAYRVIREAIEIGAYGLGEPIDIWIIEKEKNEIKVKQLSTDELNALHDTCCMWREAEKEVFRKKVKKTIQNNNQEKVTSY